MSQKKLGTSEGPVPSPGCMQAPGRCRSPLQPPSSRPGQPSQEPAPPPTMSTTTAEPGAGTRHARRAPSQGPSPPPTRRQKTWISWVTAALIARCFLHFPFNRPPVPPSLSSSLLFSSCSSSFLHFDLSTTTRLRWCVAVSCHSFLERSRISNPFFSLFDSPSSERQPFTFSSSDTYRLYSFNQFLCASFPRQIFPTRTS